ncbi:MAG: ribosome maturation factor RimM [Betaproteobacteria bacterium]|nr:ribosome maturation factor RimM [Betaproteobacteria bacterium]
MARIAAPFGIKGWIKLQTFTESPDSLDAYASWLIKGPHGWEEFELEDFAVNARGVVAKLRGCSDRTQAELLNKREVGIPREALDEPDEGEHYWIDLIGSTVLNTQGEHLGTIETLMETGANDVLVVHDGLGDTLRETLIPFIDGVVISVDREAKQITVDWQRDTE